MGVLAESAVPRLGFPALSESEFSADFETHPGFFGGRMSPFRASRLRSRGWELAFWTLYVRIRV